MEHSIDREKVIKGLNDIGGFIAGRVGFEQARNFLRTIDDAIALLKEQEEHSHELQQIINDGFEAMMVATKRIKELEALLKEQETKTGYWIDSAGNDKCSICGTEYSDLYPDYGNTHFCPNCGAKMKGR